MSSRYDGTPVRRIFDEENNSRDLNIKPQADWPEEDIIAWAISLLTTETGLTATAHPAPDGPGYLIRGDFADQPVPTVDSSAAVAFLTGVLAGYSAASHRKGNLGLTENQFGFSDLFGGLFS